MQEIESHFNIKLSSYLSSYQNTPNKFNLREPDYEPDEFSDAVLEQDF